MVGGHHDPSLSEDVPVSVYEPQICRPRMVAGDGHDDQRRGYWDEQIEGRGHGHNVRRRLDRVADQTPISGGHSSVTTCGAGARADQ